MPVGCARVGVWAESSVSRGEQHAAGRGACCQNCRAKALTQKRMSRQNRQRVAGGAGPAARWGQRAARDVSVNGTTRGARAHRHGC